MFLQDFYRFNGPPTKLVIILIKSPRTARERSLTNTKSLIRRAILLNHPLPWIKRLITFGMHRAQEMINFHFH